jgi:hypothetical protein
MRIRCHAVTDRRKLIVSQSTFFFIAFNASYNQIIGMVFTPSSDRYFMIYGADFWRNCALAVVTPQRRFLIIKQSFPRTSITACPMMFRHKALFF